MGSSELVEIVFQPTWLIRCQSPIQLPLEQRHTSPVYKRITDSVKLTKNIINLCIYIYIHNYIYKYIYIYIQHIYIYNLLRTNTVQHTECVQVNMSLDVTGNILDQQALSLDFCPTVQKARTASAATDWQQSCLNLFMVAEQWSWKHPGELQQAEGLIPEHWGTLNNSWSNKG